MIVVEGPDGSGKTVLVGQLLLEFRDRLAMRADTAEPKGEKPEEKLARRVATYRPRTYAELGEAFNGRKAQIHDRFLYSEIVYGPVLRGEAQIKPGEVKFIERALMALQCPVIICMPTWDAVKFNVDHGDHPKIVKDNLQKIYGGYMLIAERLQRSSLAFLGYDYTRAMDSKIVHQMVKNYLAQREVREL